ncbi:hypothetical protein NKH82_32730 [Mesorhizobium sp. M0915]|uniref:hypothetical protein n=1 Tax=Mesorhizobium sp. M0915 TaxID=2957027 RepID=UPI00333C3118
MKIRAFVEATVSAVIASGSRKAASAWSKIGDSSLRSTFEQWFPSMANHNHEPDETALAA